MSAKRKTPDELNELRLIANEIMRQLYEAGEREQLNILHAYAGRCIELIDVELTQKANR